MISKCNKSEAGKESYQDKMDLSFRINVKKILIGNLNFSNLILNLIFKKGLFFCPFIYAHITEIRSIWHILSNYL